MFWTAGDVGDDELGLLWWLEIWLVQYDDPDDVDGCHAEEGWYDVNEVFVGSRMV